MSVPHRRKCSECRIEFQPAPRGYNAKFCSKKCKLAAIGRRQKAFREKNKPRLSEMSRLRFHAVTKKDSEALARHYANGRKSRRKIRDWLANYKTSRGCADCGYSLHFAALQLDHEGHKTADIANLRSSVRRLEEEIVRGKCVVRCGNCHSIRTWAVKNGLDYDQVKLDLGIGVGHEVNC